MPSRSSLYLRDHTEAEIKKRGDNRSAIVTRDLERYYDVLRRSLPQFTENEGLLMMDATNGTIFPDVIGYQLLWIEVADHCRLNGAAEHWGVDGPALVERLKALDPGATAAVVDALERAWRMQKAPGDALREVGLVAPDPSAKSLALRPDDAR